MDEIQFQSAMDLIITALKERGYDPYAQLYGYVTYKEPRYITGHKNARQLIQSLDIGRVGQYLTKMQNPL